MHALHCQGALDREKFQFCFKIACVPKIHTWDFILSVNHKRGLGNNIQQEYVYPHARRSRTELTVIINVRYTNDVYFTFLVQL